MIPEWTPEEFIRKLHGILDNEDCKIIWFFGAGCSVSSGIPAASTLVDRWLPRLKHLKVGSELDWQEWAISSYGYNPNEPALSYGKVIKDLFPVLEERQKEIEQITLERDPSIGYALYAVLAADPKYGPRANVVLTTNFDDLVADAMYLMTHQKPLVVAHESLAEYVKRRRQRPLVIKLHGDAHFSPRNSDEETEELDAVLAKQITELFSDSALIFLGYGGNDESISKVLRNAPVNSFPKGIYWLGKNIPTGSVGIWLNERNELKRDVFFIKNHDFDDFFLQVKDKVGLQLPGPSRIVDLFQSLHDQLSKDENAPIDMSSPEKKDRAGRARRTLDALNLANRAREVARVDPHAADALYQQALGFDASDSGLLGGYALFLAEDLRDPGRAAAMFERALENDSTNAINLNNYGSFLTNEGTDFVKAENVFERAIAADPNSGIAFANYAILMAVKLKNVARAQELYERAVALDPNNPKTVGNYAAFLDDQKKDLLGARVMYERAIALDPMNANNLGNYALFLSRNQKNIEPAEILFRRALAIDPKHADNLSNFAQFIAQVRKDDGEAESLFARALDIAPSNPMILSGFANFLARKIGNLAQAESLFKRAIELDPENASTLAHYAVFLMNQKKDYSRAEEILNKVLVIDPGDLISKSNLLQLSFGKANDYADCAIPAKIAEDMLSRPDLKDDLRLELSFYMVVHQPMTERQYGPAIYKLITSGARSEGWNFDLNLNWARRKSDERLGFLDVLAGVICGRISEVNLAANAEWLSWNISEA